MTDRAKLQAKIADAFQALALATKKSQDSVSKRQALLTQLSEAQAEGQKLNQEMNAAEQKVHTLRTELARLDLEAEVAAKRAKPSDTDKTIELS